MPAGVGYGEFTEGRRYQRDEPGIRAAADYLNENGIPITGDNLARAMVTIQSGAGGVQQNFTGIDVTQGDDDFDGDEEVPIIRAQPGPYKTRPEGFPVSAAQQAANDPIPSQGYNPQINFAGPGDRYNRIPGERPPAPAAAAAADDGTLTPEEVEGAGVDTEDDGGMPSWLKYLLLAGGGGALARMLRGGSDVGEADVPPAQRRLPGAAQRQLPSPRGAGTQTPEGAWRQGAPDERPQLAPPPRNRGADFRHITPLPLPPESPQIEGRSSRIETGQPPTQPDPVRNLSGEAIDLEGGTGPDKIRLALEAQGSPEIRVRVLTALMQDPDPMVSGFARILLGMEPGALPGAEVGNLDPRGAPRGRGAIGQALEGRPGRGTGRLADAVREQQANPPRPLELPDEPSTAARARSLRGAARLIGR
jgi:hypothetical protein